MQLITQISCLDLLEPPPSGRPGSGPHDYLIESDFFNPEHNPITSAYLERNRKNLVLSNSVFHLYQIKATIAALATPSASHENQSDLLAVLNDELEPGLFLGMDPSRGSPGGTIAAARNGCNMI